MTFPRFHGDLTHLLSDHVYYLQHSRLHHDIEVNYSVVVWDGQADKKINEWVLETAGVNSLLATVKQRKLSYYGYW